MATFAEAPAGDVEKGAKIFKTKCVARRAACRVPAAAGAARCAAAC